MAEINYPKYLLMLRGLPYVLPMPDGTQESRCMVETMAFYSLEDFKKHAEKDHLQPERVIGVFLLGDPLDISASKVTVEVEKHEWSVPAES